MRLSLFDEEAIGEKSALAHVEKNTVDFFEKTHMNVKQ